MPFLGSFSSLSSICFLGWPFGWWIRLNSLFSCSTCSVLWLDVWWVSIKSWLVVWWAVSNSWLAGHCLWSNSWLAGGFRRLACALSWLGGRLTRTARSAEIELSCERMSSSRVSFPGSAVELAFWKIGEKNNRQIYLYFWFYCMYESDIFKILPSFRISLRVAAVAVLIIAPSRHTAEKRNARLSKSDLEFLV